MAAHSNRQAIIFTRRRSCSFAEYWKHFLRRVWTVFTRSAITPPEVNRFGWNLGHSEYIVCHWPGKYWARSAQKRERENEPKFCFLSGKQRAISPTSSQPNFTKFARKTWIREAVNPFGTKFWKFPRKRSFLPKATFLENVQRIPTSGPYNSLTIYTLSQKSSHLLILCNFVTS